jgi:3-oxoacyl-[acyl-carrier-protein] synthase-1
MAAPLGLCLAQEVSPKGTAQMRLDTVTSIGMVTNVGRDARTACAAVRAGISRLSPLADAVAYDPDLLEAPIIGAPIVGLTDGFVATGTFVRLAEATLTDLLRYGGLPGTDHEQFWRSTALVWCLPEVTSARFMWPEEEVPEILQIACAERLAGVSGLPFAVSRTGQVAQGHVGAALALRHIDQVATRTGAERVLLLATDSWLDQMALRVLLDEDRVKGAETPTGLIPGEAGAAVLLEATDTVSSTCGPQCRVLSASAMEAPHPLDQEHVSDARRAMAASVGLNLAAVAREVLEEAGCATFAGTVFVDLNGEEWKAVAWGLALMQLRDRLDDARCAIELPAATFGEIGAASAVAAVCLGARAFTGRYAVGQMALVLSMADRGQVSAILLQAAA